MSAKRLTNKEKDFIATEMLRLVVHNLMEEENISFEKAFEKVVRSMAYDVLFTFNTGVWREGPDYISTFI